MTEHVIETHSGALFGVPILLPRNRRCLPESIRGQYLFMTEVTRILRAATPYRVRALDRLIPLTGATVISPETMTEFEREMVSLAMLNRTASIERYVHAIGPGEVWPEIVMAIGVVARETNGSSRFSLPAPDVWQSVVPKLQGYLGFHMTELGGAVIGHAKWIDAAIDDARRMLICTGTRTIADDFAGESEIDGVTITTVDQAYRIHLHNESGVRVIDVPARNGGDVGAEIARLDESIRFLTGKSAVWGHETRH
jgi:hypothetical protein